ncbi:LanU-like protein [Streptomyces albus]|uniref:LanU-like protein n=1 Tax=Streptomyces albus (strain ATCC 21838 / DSM 41398 / FERM P-419 / JCM 4703 / NBRC 107858) TaxID=1081613 RepID=A0A0B5EUQ7_STRA4|nr:LanU-like protein [Streptomyces albus]AOU79807.1 LanU-like protein [Streptomyces albus]
MTALGSTPTGDTDPPAPEPPAPDPPVPGAFSTGVRRITLDAGGLDLSALLSEPEQGPPRATVVAVHGGGMSAGYFDGQAHPEQSLMTLGAQLGYTVLSVDRPGYGSSAAWLPEGLTLGEQAVVLHAALDDFRRHYAHGAGLFLLAHSLGGALVMATAAGAEADRALLGLDVSGCGHRYAVVPDQGRTTRRNTLRHWGPLRLYPPNTFATSTGLVAPVPAREAGELARWPELFAALAPRISVPVRLTFAEHEAWWRHGEQDLADLAAQLTASPRVLVERQPDAGHNISLGWAARAYHLRSLAFLEDCLTHTGRE